MTYEIMKPEEWKECIELAARAFGNYDFFSVYFPKRQRRLRFLSNMLRVEFTVNKDLVHLHSLRLRYLRETALNCNFSVDDCVIPLT